MPAGITREDLNNTGASFRSGNPVPATNPSYDSNPIPQTDPSWDSNPIPPGDPSFNSNPVNWAISPTHFGNKIGAGTATILLSQSASGYAQADANPVQAGLPAPSAAKHSLYVVVCISAGATTISGIADDLGANVYSLVRTDVNANTDKMYFYKSENIVGTPQTISVTLSQLDFAVVLVADVSRSSGSPSIDALSFAGTSGANWTGPSVTAMIRDLVLAFGTSENGQNTTITAGTGWTMDNILATNPGDTGFGFIEQQLAVSGGMYTPTVNSVGLDGGMYTVAIK